MGEPLGAQTDDSGSLPLVSIVMNCFNGEHYLRVAIDSVFAQTYGNWEIVFFDNASTDSSEAIARSYGEKLHYFRSEQTMSLGAARNAAIKNARGELIAFLDTDDRWLPDKLASPVAVFRDNPQVDFVYSNYYILHAASARTELGLRRPQPEGDVFGAFLRHYPVNLQTVMVRGSALHNLNVLFDPALQLAEEYDLFMRLLYVSKARYLKQPTAVYRVHDNMSSIRHVDKYPPEMAYILGKLRLLSQDFEKRYAHEVVYMEAKIGYWYAVAYMHKGDSKRARVSLKPYIWISPVFFALYLATYFPHAIWGLLQRLRGVVR
ncbi:UDP-Glc:alpha-D-GlcNAc-diphosphoundecaprenol beta-1,3-glucosyltransferase WfgD [Anaerolineae bacterium]|nr:UDP-Glc:alpha-D-GlcNAc-diphosphoundecaprenol beta-1,3-glucosyltransferase WfgD [Anaerolineae bacterium]